MPTYFGHSGTLTSSGGDIVKLGKWCLVHEPFRPAKGYLENGVRCFDPGSLAEWNATANIADEDGSLGVEAFDVLLLRPDDTDLGGSCFLTGLTKDVGGTAIVSMVGTGELVEAAHA